MKKSPQQLTSEHIMRMLSLLFGTAVSLAASANIGSQHQYCIVGAGLELTHRIGLNLCVDRRSQWSATRRAPARPRSRLRASNLSPHFAALELTLAIRWCLNAVRLPDPSSKPTRATGTHCSVHCAIVLTLTVQHARNAATSRGASWIRRCSVVPPRRPTTADG